MQTTDVIRPEVALDDRYSATSGRALMSGIQALVRAPLDQRRLDASRGHNTAAFISGYQGSPLGGLDAELKRAANHLDPAHVVFRPGINEELAATAIGGTQLLSGVESRRYEGVVGYWFGKNPGLDRAADAIRHSNISGTSALGGAVALIGDDPSSKSSTVPSSCEPMCRSLLMPLLTPGTVEELLAAALHAVALSRFAGLWAGVKVVADIADASAIVDLAAPASGVPELAVRTAGTSPTLLPPTNLDAEAHLMQVRLAAASEYARLADLNRVRFEPTHPRLAIVAGGLGYQATLRALDDLGLDEAALDRLGIRLIQLGMAWPLEHGEIRRLLAGVETVFVVEDKLPFVEALCREAMYRLANAPMIIGKRDHEGRPLLSERSAVGSDDVSRALVEILGDHEVPEQARTRVTRLSAGVDRGSETMPPRIPYFCSGCPHNVSTRAEPDQLVGVGIGCHIMVALDGGERRGHLLGMPQMGGEGAQWLGLAPFVDETHFTQNLGDGTFHHSGSLAIRAAIAAGVNITYRLLYNDAVAMTGGQQPEGKMDVATIARWLEIEGVRQIIVTTPDPSRYAGVGLPAIARVAHRDALPSAARELAAVSGVTVLIHDDQCATEKRRARKRGKLAAPAERIVINERVCEGCGDCGEKSTCLSVVPVETEFGRKTQIHQSSCNQDMTCLKGDCPSFLVVTPGSTRGAGAEVPTAPEAPAPSLRVERELLVRMPGVGGTGVVTVSQVLQMAAHLDGFWAAGLEQVGLAQKGGAVLSDIRFSSRPVQGQLRASTGTADVMIGFDLLGAAEDATLAVCDPERTIAVVNATAAPTAAQVTDVHALATDERVMIQRIRRVTREGSPRVVDASALAQRLFGDHLPANMILVGAAFQAGLLPVSADAIERAITLNGAGVSSNLAAFRWGRATVADPESVPGAQEAKRGPKSHPRALGTLQRTALASDLHSLVATRIEDLRAYQNAAYAHRYRDAVLRVAMIEQQRTTDGHAVQEAYARGLHKLMAYKDEYEVARLHLDPHERARVHETFGPDATVQIMLHPPVLRALGMQSKIRVGSGALPALRALRAARALRGTRLDPFGRTEMRRLERSLVDEYMALVDDGLRHLNDRTAGLVADLAALPDVIRGYEAVKRRGVESFRRRADEILIELPTVGQDPPVELPVEQTGGSR